MNPTSLPAAGIVGMRAAEILAAITGHADFDRLMSSSKYYADCWASFTGYPIIARWDLEADKDALFVEAMRALALKAAVYDATSDEILAELLVALPVDEMCHAILAQHNIVTRIQVDLGLLLPHMTDLETFGYESGGYTATCYQAAGWGVPPDRYWVGTEEAKRRLAILQGRYALGGMHDNGRRHDLDFAAAA